MVSISDRLVVKGNNPLRISCVRIPRVDGLLPAEEDEEDEMFSVSAVLHLEELLNEHIPSVPRSPNTGYNKMHINQFVDTSLPMTYRRSSSINKVNKVNLLVRGRQMTTTLLTPSLKTSNLHTNRQLQRYTDATGDAVKVNNNRMCCTCDGKCVTLMRDMHTSKEDGNGAETTSSICKSEITSGTSGLSLIGRGISGKSNGCLPRRFSPNSEIPKNSIKTKYRHVKSAFATPQRYTSKRNGHAQLNLGQYNGYSLNSARCKTSHMRIATSTQDDPFIQGTKSPISRPGTVPSNTSNRRIDTKRLNDLEDSMLEST